MHDPTSLGAALYVPATRADLELIARGAKLPQVRTIIFCTEDAIGGSELQLALENLRALFLQLSSSNERRLFVRVRSPAVLKSILDMPGVDFVDGFVLPKLTISSLREYLALLRRTHHSIMPILETREVFDQAEMIRLLRSFDGKGVRDRILILRIGGNDLLSLIGMRRPRGRTIYQTPIGPVIARLVTTFVPHGFFLSAPVFEYLNDAETLRREVDEDLAHGLVGKTAIHPDQVQLIEQRYRVGAADLRAADRILSEDAPAVFKLDDAMCEPATHRNWARSILKAASHYGECKETL